jgi:dephospho-CoA kinase
VSKRWPGKIIIGLTGNIGTGKSVVRRMLEALDAFGIDADGLAHRAMSPGAPAFQPIVDQFGKWVLQPDGQIDRAKLAKVVFNDPDALAHLESITHPIVKQVVDLLIKRSKKEIVVVEAIKLLEAGLGADADAVWVVDAPPDVQLKRLVEQRKMPQAEAQMRIAAQPPQSDKLARANTIIYNGGGYENTFEQVQKHLNELVEKVRPAPAGTAAPAAGTPAPAAAAAQPAPAAAAPAPSAELVVRRGGPKDAEAIANFLNKMTGQSLTRTDVMMRFGEKAYMMAEAGGQLRGLGGVMVENLICRIDELYLAEGAPIDATLPKLLDHIEKTANELQSEVSLLFLPLNAPEVMKEIVRKREYDLMQASELRIPDWREAAEESAPPNTSLNVKRLREDRVLKPI